MFYGAVHSHSFTFINIRQKEIKGQGKNRHYCVNATFVQCEDLNARQVAKKM